MRVAVLDHGMGNLRSVTKALEAAGADVTLTSDELVLKDHDALCVPGQGIFGRCVDRMHESGLDRVVRNWIENERPFLGICLGMQILFEDSEESGGATGLGVLEGHVRRLPSTVRVPHIGWNEVETRGSSNEYFYFDHSYAVEPGDHSIVEGWCAHGTRFAAWVSAGSVTGVQFHPEKSAAAGISLLRTWVEARGRAPAATRNGDR